MPDRGRLPHAVLRRDTVREGHGVLHARPSRTRRTYGRKFKIAFSGCQDEACGLSVCTTSAQSASSEDGKRGFEFYVGGGLGTVPQQAKLLSEFVPEEELLAACAWRLAACSRSTARRRTAIRPD